MPRSITSPFQSRERIVWLWPLGVLVAIAIVAGTIFLIRASDSKQEAAAVFPAVAIKDNAFLPATLRVKAGETVLWTNSDMRPHKLSTTETGLPEFDSLTPLQQGESYGYTFDTPGTYTYYDSTQPEGVQGTIIVE